MAELKSALAGSVAGAIATSLVYPIDTIKTKWSIGFDSKGLPYNSLMDVLNRSTKERGFLSLYQGLHAKLGMTVLQRFIYLFVLTYLQRRYEKRYGKLSVAASLVLGYIAGVASCSIVTPLEVVQTKLQISEPGSPQASISTIVQDIGISGLYAGFSTNLILCVNPAIETASFDRLKHGKMKTAKSLNSGDIFLLGAAAKMIATLVTYPYVRAKLLQQGAGDRRSVFELLLEMTRNWTLYKGLESQLFKVVLNSAITQVLREKLEFK